MAQTILIVEDDRDVRGLFRTALMFEAFNVLEAENGLAALRLLDRVPPPDLILLDLRMPVMNGSVFMQELAGQAHLRHIPVVVVTATLGPDDARQAKCVLRKPVSIDDLVRTVRSCLISGARSAT
jgi:CheY-like chemotaxis protein